VLPVVAFVIFKPFATFLHRSNGKAKAQKNFAKAKA
jgi:hypothetical protein